ncbi:hypothetical protein Tco_0343457 [Tanacetum coccineum]
MFVSEQIKTGTNHIPIIQSKERKVKVGFIDARQSLGGTSKNLLPVVTIVMGLEGEEDDAIGMVDVDMTGGVVVKKMRTTMLMRLVMMLFGMGSGSDDVFGVEDAIDMGRDDAYAPSHHSHSPTRSGHFAETMESSTGSTGPPNYQQ